MKKEDLPHGRPEFFMPKEHPELAALLAIPFIPFVVIWLGIAYVSTKLKRIW
jgi:hypothetical protein